MPPEPKKAFPYKPPTSELINKYRSIFDIDGCLPNKILKTCFDKISSFLLLIIFLPILFLIKAIFLLEGLLIPENSGPMFFYYYAVSQGKVFRKYKIRIIKMKYIDSEKAKSGDWLAYTAEWNSESRTYIGQFVKKFYLDEIPQLWCVLTGKMSIVGPRPLAVIHYKRDIAQGNISRRLIRGGLLGLGHILKGKPEFGNPLYEYEYINRYINSSELKLLFIDFNIIFRGIILILKGGGN